MTNNATVRIGSSGWEYKHWAGRFYPRDLSRDRWLEHYAAEFDTVELNNSFYRLPDADQFAAWGRRVPKDFAFAVKASRYLTHLKRLRDPKEPLARLWSRARRLGRRLGPMLYQLPPRWTPDHERLGAFLDAVPPHPQAVEFRDRRWYGNPTFDLLERADVALCLHDMQGSATGRMVVGPFIYVRFHFGTQKYGGRYEDARLDEWAEFLASQARAGLPIFAYFNNDVGGHAPRDAVRLRAKILALL